MGCGQLPQSRGFKYLRYDGYYDGAGDGQPVWGGACGNTGAVPDCCSEERAESQGEAPALASVCVSTLIYGHDLWAVTKRTRIQVAEMRFLWKVAGLSLREELRHPGGTSSKAAAPAGGSGV